jgi:hypothetical protein
MANIGYVRVSNSPETQLAKNGWLDKIGHKALASLGDDHGLRWDGYDEYGAATWFLTDGGDLTKFYFFLRALVSADQQFVMMVEK